MSFLNIGNFKKIWNHPKTILFVHTQYCPPPSPPQSSVYLVDATTIVDTDECHC
jgi:hypothetical protein